MAGANTVSFTSRAKKDFEALELRVKPSVIEAIRNLAASPLAGKKLKGEFSPYRSYRVGSYRILYHVRKNSLTIVHIEHRKDVYR